MSLSYWEDIFDLCNQLNRESIHENKQRKNSWKDTTKWEKEVGSMKNKFGNRNVTNSISEI